MAHPETEACVHAAAHDADAEALLNASPETPDRGPGGRRQHVELVAGRVRLVGRYQGLPPAAASVSAYRTDDPGGVRWAEPGQPWSVTSRGR